MAKRKKKHERRRAREEALSLLYSGDITERDATTLIDEGDYPEDIELGEYAEGLVRGVTEKCADIDGRIASTSENWAVDRMPVVDRAILRLAVYEMVYVDEVPVSVAINEAVELAKVYGGEDESPRFVNGVLGRIARALEDSSQESAPAEDVAADTAAGAAAEEHASADAGTVAGAIAEALADEPAEADVAAQGEKMPDGQ